MRFQVPQFTEVEYKIVGPLTLKQFIYLAGAAGACVVLYTFLPKYIAFALMLPVALFGAALAFYKINNRPFIRVVESFLKYILTSRLYIWKHEQRAITPEESASATPVFVPKLSESKLRDLSWGLEVKQNLNPEEVKPITINEGKIGK